MIAEAGDTFGHREVDSHENARFLMGFVPPSGKVGARDPRDGFSAQSIFSGRRSGQMFHQKFRRFYQIQLESYE